MFWSIKNSGEILNKLKSRGFLASGLSACGFSALYTTLPCGLVMEELTELVEQAFSRGGSLCLACNDENDFFTSEQPKRCGLWSCWGCVVRSIVFWTVCLWNLARSCMDKLWVFRWVLVVVLLLQICFCFVMRETLCCLCRAVIGLILLRPLARPPDVWIT